MSKPLSYWAALASIDLMLKDETEEVYLWTFTGASDEIRQDRAMLMKAWDRFLRSRSFQALEPRGYRATEQGTSGEECWHIHAVTDQRWPIAVVRDAAIPLGFGRINVKPVPRAKAGYAAKYLLKDAPVKGQRRWASFGGAARVPSSQIKIYDQFTKRAVETRFTFPNCLDDSFKWWWAGCVHGLAASFLRRLPSACVPSISHDTLETYGGHEGYCRANWTAMDLLCRRAGNAKWVHPRVGVYLGRWAPEYQVVRLVDGEVVRQWDMRKCHHLVGIDGKYVWVEERGQISWELPVPIGGLALVGFFVEPLAVSQVEACRLPGVVVAMAPAGSSLSTCTLPVPVKVPVAWAIGIGESSSGEPLASESDAKLIGGESSLSPLEAVADPF